MHFRKYYLLLITLVTFSCSHKTKEGFELDGTINNVPSGSLVYLDQLSFGGKLTTIDTAKVDDKGNFQMKGIIKEEALYRLRYGNNKYILLVLDELPTSAKVHADTTDIFEKPYEVTGSTKSNSLLNLLNNINQRRIEMEGYMSKLSDNSGTYSDSAKQILFSEYQNKNLEARKYVLNFVDTVNSPTLAVFALANFMDPQGSRDEINTAAQKLKQKFPNNEAVTELVKALQPQNENPYEPTQLFKNGTPLPDISGQNPEGKTLSLSSLKGKVVLVDFWASWCAPCRAENPNVVRIYHKFKDKGFDVFSYSLDEKKDKWVEAIKKDGLTWPMHVSSLKGWQSDVCAQFKITSIPSSYLIDRNGNVIAFNLRGQDLEKAVEKSL